MAMRRQARQNMLKLRSIGLSDYSVLEGRQRIGRIRLATERMPCVWLWSVNVHLPGGLPMGSANENIRHTSLGGPRFQRSESLYPEHGSPAKPERGNGRSFRGWRIAISSMEPPPPGHVF